MVSDDATDRERRQCWFPLRVTYSREMRVREILVSEGIECFIPMTVVTGKRNGVDFCKEVPAVNNLCFARSRKMLLDDILAAKGMRSYVSYIWDRATRKPSIVPDKSMDDFIRISEARYEDIVYLQRVSSTLRSGQKVRVKSGPFAGVEGVVVRVKRSRRVMVELPDMFAVATSYIPKDNLEIV